MSLSNKVKSFFQAVVMKPSPAAVSQAFKVLFSQLPLSPPSLPLSSPLPILPIRNPNIRKSSSRSLKPHVPLIKFRKGSAFAGSSHHGETSTGSAPPPQAFAAAAARAPSKPLKQNEAYQLPIIEDWQLQRRFQRRELDEEEIAYINRGGPDKL